MPIADVKIKSLAEILAEKKQKKEQPADKSATSTARATKLAVSKQNTPKRETLKERLARMERESAAKAYMSDSDDDVVVASDSSPGPQSPVGNKQDADATQCDVTVTVDYSEFGAFNSDNEDLPIGPADTRKRTYTEATSSSDRGTKAEHIGIGEACGDGSKASQVLQRKKTRQSLHEESRGVEGRYAGRLQGTPKRHAVDSQHAPVMGFRERQAAARRAANGTLSENRPSSARGGNQHIDPETDQGGADCQMEDTPADACSLSTKVEGVEERTEVAESGDGNPATQPVSTFQALADGLHAGTRSVDDIYESVQNWLEKGRVSEVFEELAKYKLLSSVSAVTFRAILVQCQRHKDEVNGSELWKIGRSVYDQLEKATSSTAEDRLTLLEILCHAKQSLHVLDLLNTMRNKGELSNVPDGRDVSVASLIYPDIASLAEGHPRLCMSLAEHYLDDVDKPNISVVCTILAGLCADLKTGRMAAPNFLRDTVNKGCEVDNKTIQKVLSAQIHMGEMATAINIVHDLLTFRTDALVNPDSITTQLVQLCTVASRELGQAYVDDVLNLFVYLCTTSASVINCEVTVATFEMCLRTQSVSRMLIQLRASILAGQTADLSQLERVAYVCFQREDTRAFDLLTMANNLGLQLSVKLVSSVVQALLSANDINRAIKIVDDVSAEGIHFSEEVLHNLLEAMAKNEQWSRLVPKLCEIFSRGHNLPSECLYRISLEMSVDQLDDVVSIAEVAAAHSVDLPRQFLGPVLANASAQSETDKNYGLAQKVIRVYEQVKNFSGMITSLQSESKARRRLDNGSDATDIPKYLIPMGHIVYIVGNSQPAYLANIFDDMHAMSIVCSVGMLSFMIRKLGIAREDTALLHIFRALRSRIASDVEVLPLEPSLFYFLFRHYADEGDMRHQFISVLRPIDLITLYKSASGEDQCLILEILWKDLPVEVFQLDELVKRIPLESEQYSLIVDAYMKHSQLPISVLQAHTVFQIRPRVEMLDKMLEHALALRQWGPLRQIWRSYEHHGLEHQARADLVKRSVRALGGTTDIPQNVLLAEKIFIGAISGGHAYNRIVDWRVNPWIINLGSLTECEMFWALRSHLADLQNLQMENIQDLKIEFQARQGLSNDIVNPKQALQEILSHKLNQPLTPDTTDCDDFESIITIRRDELGLYLHPEAWFKAETCISDSTVDTTGSAAALQPHVFTAGTANNDLFADSERTSPQRMGSDSNPKGLIQQVYRDKVASIIVSATKSYYPQRFDNTSNSGRKEDFKHFCRKQTREYVKAHESRPVVDEELEKLKKDIYKRIDTYFKKHASYSSQSKARKRDYSS